MTTLAEMGFDGLQVGMKFKHPEHGEQIILDLGRSQLGPAIQFHNSQVYNGQIPQLGEDESEINIFQRIAQNTFPYGAEKWEYLGMVEPEQVKAHGWGWFHVNCPHCNSVQPLLAPARPAGQRQCRNCGMVFNRPAEPVT